MYPSDVSYTSNHEFIKFLDNNTALVGITSYAQEALGDVVFVTLPRLGSKFDAGDEFSTVESVKTVSEVYMPSAGKVIEVNNELEDKPELLNEDPFGRGWMVKIQLVDGKNSDLMDADSYQELVDRESN